MSNTPTAVSVINLKGGVGKITVTHLGNAPSEWSKIAKEILTKIGLSKQKTKQ